MRRLVPRIKHPDRNKPWKCSAAVSATANKCLSLSKSFLYRVFFFSTTFGFFLFQSLTELFSHQRFTRLTGPLLKGKTFSLRMKWNQSSHLLFVYWFQPQNLWAAEFSASIKNGSKPLLEQLEVLIKRPTPTFSPHPLHLFGADLKNASNPEEWPALLVR